MYQIESSAHVLKARKRLFFLRHWPRVNHTVLFLGFTSLLTDISAEMVSTVLPLYFIFGLHLPPLAFGIVDGLYQGAAALVRVASGFVADRWRRYKEVALVGYSLSAICKVGFLFVGSVWTALATIVLIDRIGKGIRTAPRDALLSLSTPPEELGTAFGVHRALDTAGAMLGPLIAFGVLSVMVTAYDVIFVISFCFAVLGVGIIALFVKNHPVAAASGSIGTSVSFRAAIGLLGAPQFRIVVVIGALLSLATVSDAFLYLSLQRRLTFNTGYFPLLYVATALIYMLLAVPMGRLADRMGRSWVFLGGYVLLVAVYGVLLLPAVGTLAVVSSLGLLGAYYAATDGVLMAMASAVLPAEVRSSGLALLTTATSLGRLCASVLFGLLWTWWGVAAATWCFLGALTVAILLAGITFMRTHSRVNYG